MNNYFVAHWMKRAKRLDGAEVDFADRYISLWIAFNGWMKKEFGVDTRDCELINKVKIDEKLLNIFTELNDSNSSFQGELENLGKISIVDRRGINPDLDFSGSFEDYINSIYRIRCNLFHGSKSTKDVDKSLMVIAYNTLLLLFERRLESET